MKKHGPEIQKIQSTVKKLGKRADNCWETNLKKPTPVMFLVSTNGIFHLGFVE